MARDWMSSSRSRGPSVLGRPGIDGEVTQTIIILLKGSAGKPFKHTGSGPSRSAHFATGLGEQQQQQQQQQPHWLSWTSAYYTYKNKTKASFVYRPIWWKQSFISTIHVSRCISTVFVTEIGLRPGGYKDIAISVRSVTVKNHYFCCYLSAQWSACPRSDDTKWTLSCQLSGRHSRLCVVKENENQKSTSTAGELLCF